MKVRDVMTRAFAVAAPADSVRDVAKRMAGSGVSALPVCDGERLLGMVSARDIVVEAVASGRDAEACVADVMDAEIDCVFEDEDLEEGLLRLGRGGRRCLPVLDHHHRLTGMLSRIEDRADPCSESARAGSGATAEPARQGCQVAPTTQFGGSPEHLGRAIRPRKSLGGPQPALTRPQSRVD